MATTNDPLMALAPNYMGDQMANSGVGMISANYGLGLGALTNEQAEDSPKLNSEHMGVERVRVNKAREFGKTKENVF